MKIHMTILFAVILSMTSCVTMSPEEEKLAANHVPQRCIDDLEDRIASIPKSHSQPVSQVLKHLDLWEYRQEMRPFRRSNHVGLNLNETETIVFIAEGEPKAYTRGEFPGHESWWDSEIKHLQI